MKLDEYESLANTEEGQRLLNPWPELPAPSTPPEFPVSTLPTNGKDMVLAVAEAIQVPVGMAACFMLGAISTAVVGQASVHVDKGYEEPAQLYIAVSAQPSERKSACMSALFKPIFRYTEEENASRASKIAESRAVKAMKEAELNKAQTKGGNIDRVKTLAREIEEYVETKPFELLLSDATPEALMAAMARNNGRIAIVSAESGLLSILAGCYSQSGVLLDPVLHGYTGEMIMSARIGRATPKINKAMLSVCLAAQPAVLRSFVENETMLNRGVVARFLLSEPESLLGRRKVVGAPVPDHIATRYENRVIDLLKENEMILELSADASDVLNEWKMEVEKRLAPDGDLRDLGTGWGGKLCGNTARIAGLLCLLANEGMSISQERMQAAVTISQYFIKHMLALTGADLGLTRNAAELLKYLKDQGEPEFSLANVRHILRRRKRFSRKEVVDAAVAELAKAGYIRKAEKPEWNGVGRPPENRYALHPGLQKIDQVEVEEL